MESVVPALARKINEAFPELGGRAFAVAEVEINREHLPRLPACMVALQHEEMQGGKLDASRNVVKERIIVDFWFKPVVYTENGELCDQKTPEGDAVYYAFYDYGAIRDQLLSALNGWQSPQGAVLSYTKLEMSGDKFAVTLTFSFDHIWNWCDDSAADPPQPAKFGFCVKPRVGQ